MPDMPARKPPTVRLRRLGQEMQRLREEAGLSRDQAAERTRMDPSSLWRLETAKNRPQRRTVLTLLDLYGVTKREDQARYVDLLTKSSELGWLTDFEEALPEDYQTYISFESGANRLICFEPSFVHGLLQTPEYARALIRGLDPTLDEEDVARRAEVRARRQAALEGKANVALWMVLDEAVLHRKVGGDTVMQAQLEHLATMARRKDTVLQIVPFDAGAHPGSRGAFTLMEFPDPDPALVYIETLTGNLFLEKPAEVSQYRANFEQLIAQALSPQASLRMITAIGAP
ncbi:helix-turn-helix transcriptional regulator [Actinoplanes sp. NPDC051633]|uniref:helix-turn-helix domain-containing protein n=1 Tax=Actinoplanes sp. NPDC051633 TaxID=3155670 RepID=UPI00344879AA